MLSVFGFVAFIVHASIFCLRFSQKQSANQPKKIQGNGLLLNIKAHAKIQALLKEKKFYPKKSLTSLLHQAIQLLMVATCIIGHFKVPFCLQKESLCETILVEIFVP